MAYSSQVAALLDLEPAECERYAYRCIESGRERERDRQIVGGWWRRRGSCGLCTERTDSSTTGERREAVGGGGRRSRIGAAVCTSLSALVGATHRPNLLHKLTQKKRQFPQQPLRLCRPEFPMVMSGSAPLPGRCVVGVCAGVGCVVTT